MSKYKLRPIWMQLSHFLARAAASRYRRNPQNSGPLLPGLLERNAAAGRQWALAKNTILAKVAGFTEQGLPVLIPETDIGVTTATLPRACDPAIQRVQPGVRHANCPELARAMRATMDMALNPQPARALYPHFRKHGKA